MSSFNDATFRSQQMLAPYQMQGAMNKTAGIQRIGDAAVQAAGMWNQAQGNAAELALRTAEADTRIASFQQEQQLNQYKLQQMMALDQAAVSRHGVTMAAMQADMAVITRDEAKQKLDAMKGDSEAQTQKNRLLQLQAEVATGMRYNPNTGKSEPIDKAELDAMQHQYGAFEKARRPRSDAGNTIDAQIRALDNRRQRAFATISSFNPEVTDEMKAEARAEYDRLTREIHAIDPTYVAEPPPPGGMSGPIQTKDQIQRPDQEIRRRGAAGKSLSPEALFNVQQNAFADPQWQGSPFWSKLNVDETTRMHMSQGIAAFADSLAKVNSENGRNIDPQMLHQYVMQSVQKDPASASFLMMLSGYSDEEIKMNLPVLFSEIRGSDINSAIERAQSYANQLTGDR